jgi:hypothetical protein
MTLFSASLITLGIYLYTKYRESYINKLKGDVRDLSSFTMLNTIPNKQQEMFQLLNKKLRKN